MNNHPLLNSSIVAAAILQWPHKMLMHSKAS